MSQRFEDLGKVLSACINPFIEHLPEAYQRLARATCWLADITWLEYPDYRGKLAAEKMLGMSVVGISHAERVWMAAALHIRYTGVFPRGSVFRGLLTKKERKSAFFIGLALRMIMTASGGIPAIIENFTITSKKKNHLPFICRRQCRGWTHLCCAAVLTPSATTARPRSVLSWNKSVAGFHDIETMTIGGKGKPSCHQIDSKAAE